MKIAEKIVALRGKESRARFAAKLGINANTLRNYESGLSLPNSDVVAKICMISNVDPTWLLFEETESTEKPSKAPIIAEMKPVNPEQEGTRCEMYREDGNSDDTLELPPTSTIEDNREMYQEILRLYEVFFRYYRNIKYSSSVHVYDKTDKAFLIPSDSKYASYHLWPEAMGHILIEYLQLRIKMIEEEGEESWRKDVCMIPSDDELNRREAEVFRRLNLKPTSKDVVSWFSCFFGRDTKLKRSRFCRFAFIVYAEEYISSLQLQKIG